MVLKVGIEPTHENSLGEPASCKANPELQLQPGDPDLTGRYTTSLFEALKTNFLHARKLIEIGFHTIVCIPLRETSIHFILEVSQVRKKLLTLLFG